MAQILSDAAKDQIIRVLREQNYPTYGWLLEVFDVYLTDDPEVVGYMLPERAKIVLNENLNTYQVSVVVRHEILHEYLSHGPRGQAYKQANPNKLIIGDDENIAADFEISNRGYTEADKRTIKNLMLGDQILKGLVTEQDRPGWENLTFEQMLDKLAEENEDIKKQLREKIQQLVQMDPEDIQDLIDQAQSQAQNQAQQQNQNQGRNQSGDQKNSENKELRDQAKQAADQLGKLQDQAERLENPNEPFDTPQEQKQKRDIAARVEEIKRRLSDLRTQQSLIDEVERARAKEKVDAIKERELRRARDPLNKFRINFQNFIKDQVAGSRESSWHRPNKNYVGSGYMVPGILSKESTNIPSINVYWDVSGSFSGFPEKTRGAESAIATINQYVKQGKVVVKAYYVGSKVSNVRSEVEGTGGADGYAVIQHLKETHPTNAVIISDSDIDVSSGGVTLPGAVWMLFFASEAPGFEQAVQGKKQTKVYFITDW